MFRYYSRKRTAPCAFPSSDICPQWQHNLDIVLPPENEVPVGCSRKRDETDADTPGGIGDPVSNPVDTNPLIEELPDPDGNTFRPIQSDPAGDFTACFNTWSPATGIQLTQNVLRGVGSTTWFKDTLDPGVSLPVNRYTNGRAGNALPPSYTNGHIYLSPWTTGEIQEEIDTPGSRVEATYNCLNYVLPTRRVIAQLRIHCSPDAWFPHPNPNPGQFYEDECGDTIGFSQCLVRVFRNGQFRRQYYFNQQDTKFISGNFIGGSSTDGVTAVLTIAPIEVDRIQFHFMKFINGLVEIEALPATCDIIGLPDTELLDGQLPPDAPIQLAELAWDHLFAPNYAVGALNGAYPGTPANALVTNNHHTRATLSLVDPRDGSTFAGILNNTQCLLEPQIGDPDDGGEPQVCSGTSLQGFTFELDTLCYVESIVMTLVWRTGSAIRPSFPFRRCRLCEETGRAHKVYNIETGFQAMLDNTWPVSNDGTYFRGEIRLETIDELLENGLRTKYVVFDDPDPVLLFQGIHKIALRGNNLKFTNA